MPAPEELAFDLVARDRGANDGIEKVGRTSAAAALKIDQANLKVERSQRAVGQAIEKYGKSSLEAREASAKLAQSQQNLQKQLAGTQKQAEATGESVEGLGAAVKGAAAVAVGAGVGAAISKGMDITAGVDKLTGQLGATVKEGERLGAIAGQVYSGAYGENLDQVNDAIKNVSQNIGKLGDTGTSSMQSITEDTLSLVQAFDVDLLDVTKAAGTLLRTGLAPDAQYAMDLITVGLQKIPGAAEDLLDTFTEYSVQFKALGLTGDQALAFIGAAMEGGARNTDLAADALKEFNLRAKDTTNTDAQSAINELGLSAQRTAEAIAGGGSGATTAMAELLGRLREIPNEADRSRLATALLGTQAEDLQSALFAVDPAKFLAGMDGVAGSADRLNATLGDNGKTKIEAYRRQMELLIANAAGAEGPLGTAAAGAAAFGGAAAGGAATVAQLGASLALIPGAGARATAALTAVKGAAVTLAPVFAVVAAGIAAVETSKLIGEFAVADVETTKLSGSLRQLGADGKLGGAGLALFSEGLGPFRRESEDTSEALKRFGIDAYNALDQGWDARLNRFGRMGEAEAEFRKETEQLDQAFAALVKSGNVDDATAGLDQFKQAGVEAGVPLATLDAQFPQFNEAIKASAAATGEASTATTGYAAGLDSQGDAAATAGKSQKELNASISEYTSQILALRGDQRAFEEAIDSASASVKANGKTLDITTEKGRANQAALDAIASSGLKLAEQTPKGSNAQKHFADTLATTRKRLEAAAYQMTGSRTKARQLASAILDIPKGKNIRITSNIDSQAAKVRGLQGRLDRVAGRSYSYTVKEILISENRRDAAMSRRLEGRAVGGPVKAGTPYIVGERGQELFVPKEDGVILPEVPKPGRPDVYKQRRWGTPENIHGPGRITVPKIEFVSDGSKASALLLAIIRDSVRVRGGNVQLVLGK
jgi:phage-related minor tail protein